MRLQRENSSPDQRIRNSGESQSWDGPAVHTDGRIMAFQRVPRPHPRIPRDTFLEAEPPQGVPLICRRSLSLFLQEPSTAICIGVR